ncbi:hypothetical protein [Natronolimnohabitans innermongolicus]|uniref:Uncharacterized protein n=1 Tax=Natronolimnohabitans innermongolicus JCM 12255 TaxID=1227499 RepID=L9WNR9_9EURY|nr:hypothetical protein [Natronolimnohabitans innermongolicus]ELY51012.1 hypothetical protein C493_18551 [Natronolimnohabitans innermongolicus JCM 12255]
MDGSDTDAALEFHGADTGTQTDARSRIRDWLLLEGDRRTIAAGLCLAVFVSSVLLNEAGVIAFTNDDSMTRLANGMIAGTLSVVTLVVTISQAILSREFVSADDAREKLQGVLDVRENVATRASVPASPASPSRLLELLVDTVDEHATALEDATSTSDSPERRELLRQYTSALDEQTARTRRQLERTSFGTFTAVSAAIDYDAHSQLYLARQLRSRETDSGSTETTAALDGLIDSLELFVVAEGHFKTTYLQRELTRFSRLTIYCGIPAVLAALLVGLIYADAGGLTIGATAVPYVVSALLAVVISPIALLASYLLRSAAVTRRTASVGPMLPSKEPDAGPFDVTDGE